MRRLLITVAAAALALSACETATPYQPLNARHQGSGGYSDQQVEQNRWIVRFQGNSLTSRERVERYLLYRAAELTTQQGYDWFTTVERNTERKSDYISDAPYGGFGPYGIGGGYWGPGWAYRGRGGLRGGFGYGYGGGFGGGFGGYGGFPTDLQQISEYTAQAEVLMGHGPKPATDRRAFDAHQVIEHLRPGIEYPK